MDSTNSEWKIFWKKIFSGKFQKAELELPLAGSYLYSIYIALGVIINVEMTYSTCEDVCRLYTNTMPFYIGNVGIRGFGDPCGPWNLPLLGHQGMTIL